MIEFYVLVGFMDWNNVPFLDMSSNPKSASWNLKRRMFHSPGQARVFRSRMVDIDSQSAYRILRLTVLHDGSVSTEWVE